MNKKIYTISLALLALQACDYNDKYFDGLDELVAASQTDVKTLEYTLTDADYSTIGNYTAIDAEDTTELKGLAKTKAFSTTAFAAKYIPKLISGKYTTADDQSAVKVTYNVVTSLSETLVAVNDAQTYTITEDDYASIWGDDTDATYLTPATESKIKNILRNNITDPTTDDFIIVSYEYSATEPATETDKTLQSNWEKVDIYNYPTSNSYNYATTKADLSAYTGKNVRVGFRYTSTTDKAGTIELANLQIDEPRANRNSELLVYAAGTDGSYTLAPKVATDNKYFIAAKTVSGNYVMPFGYLTGDKPYGYFSADSIVYAESYEASTIEPYLIELTSGTSYGFTMKNANDKYIYNSGTYNSFNIADAAPESGAEWIFVTKNKGLFSISNATTNKIINYDGSHKNFGIYGGSYLANHLYSTSTDAPEGYAFVDVVNDNLSYIWSATKAYGLKASAYSKDSGSSYASESWVVTPEIDLSSASSPLLSVDLAVNNFGDADFQDYFGVYVSEDYEEGSSFVANKSLKASTTMRYAVYTFNGSVWSQPNNVVILNAEDYAAMGSNYSNFSSSFAPETYLPIYLKTKYPYAQAEDTKIVVYHYYDATAKATVVKASEYQFDGSEWNSTESFSATTSQFVKNNNQWTFDPSVTINLPYSGKPQTTVDFLQAMTDWVWENIDQAQLGVSAKGQGYVTSYGNNEYYTGASAYYAEFDWRPAKFREQYSDGFKDCATDEDVLNLAKEHTIEVIAGVLPQLYPDANVIEGIDVVYTINFYIYDVNGAYVPWTIQYKVTGKAQFEYIEDSLKEVVVEE